MTSIKLNNVQKLYRSKKALDSVSFSLKSGEIIGFLGPNGAGKTTTMKLVMGLLKPSEGTIHVNGFSPLSRRLELLQTIGYLPENNPLYTQMKVKEYLQFIAKTKKVTNEEVETIAEQVNIDDVMEKEIGQLSRGYKQRVGLAAALIGDPDILVLDEPTSGLDPIEQEKIKAFIKSVAKDKIVIFSTHILSEAEDIANRLIIINQGNIVYDDKKPKGKGTLEKLFKDVVSGKEYKLETKKVQSKKTIKKPKSKRKSRK